MNEMLAANESPVFSFSFFTYFYLNVSRDCAEKKSIHRDYFVFVRFVKYPTKNRKKENKSYR